MGFKQKGEFQWDSGWNLSDLSIYWIESLPRFDETPRRVAMDFFDVEDGIFMRSMENLLSSRRDLSANYIDNLDII